MKLSYRDTDQFLKSPNPKVMVTLIYGPDHGLMQARTIQLAKNILDDINDPFNAVHLRSTDLADDPGKFIDEALAGSLMGGQRLMRVEDASDKLTPTIKEYLANPNPDCFIILMAGDLGPRSSLRKLCEQMENTASIACYVQEVRDINRLIREKFTENNIQADQDAIAFLAENLTGDHGRTMMEIEKILIFADGLERLTLEQAQEISGAAGAQNMDDLIDSICMSDHTNALKYYNKLIEEGIVTIVILRSLQNHFRRLHFVLSGIGEGNTQMEMVKALQPPIFFKRQDSFNAQLRNFSTQQCFSALEKLVHCELETKKTGAPVETLCAQLIIALTQTARQRNNLVA